MIDCDWMEAYQDWTFDHIRIGNKCEDHSRLLELLSSREFVWLVDHDENRESDGFMLRESFSSEYDCDPYFWEGRMPNHSSILEMMIALAMRVEDVVEDPEQGDRTGVWFWKMIESMGLDKMNDRRFDVGKANKIIDRWLNREYEPNGKGGLFIVNDPRIDMRKTEIWYQMHAWLMENFAF